MQRNDLLTTRTGTTTDAVDLNALARQAPATDDLLQLADWLATNGPAHLSVIERIELAERLITRRRFLVGAGGLLGLSVIMGCGPEEEATVPTATVAATRTVSTPRGSVTIPANPQRVVAIYTSDLENALILGLPLIGGPGEQGVAGATFPPYLIELFGAQLNGMSQIVQRPEINFEQIAALQPDLIFASYFSNFDIGYDRLDAIAPTVTIQHSKDGQNVPRPWQDVLRNSAAQFAREAAAEEWIARFEQRAADLRERLAPRWGGATFAIVDPSSSEIFVTGPQGGHIPSTLSEQLGLVFADSVRTLVAELDLLDSDGASVSYELLGEIDADILFVPVWAGPDGTTDRSGINMLTAQALWATLPAVQAGQVHEFSGDLWYTSGVTAMVFLDVVERTLLS